MNKWQGEGQRQIESGAKCTEVARSTGNGKTGKSYAFHKVGSRKT